MSTRTPPFRRRDADRALLSHAQAGEDVRLARVLWDRRPGFYVDVGAGDPVANSVTKLFYDAGWRGINVEPGPAFERLAVARPADVNLQVVVGAAEGTRDFWVCRTNPELSSFTPPAASDVPEGTSFERRRIRSRTLASIVDEHGAGRTIDFLKIDVEGAEGEVLASIDLRRIRPLVLVVESIAPTTHEPAHERWEPVVVGAGYELAAFDGINRFYVPEEHRELVEVIGYPLSPLDRFEQDRPLAQLTPGATPSDASFPTLADELAAAKPPPVEHSGLLVVLGALADRERLEGVLPPGSTVLGLETLEELHGLVREDRRDVVLVTDLTRATRPVVEGLQSALARDSACATVSFHDDAVVDVRVPGPPLERPSPGLVLARRNHLLLALDEADLLGRDEVCLIERAPGRPLDDALAAMTRPGFVHRAWGLRVDRSPSSAPVTPRAHRTAGRIVIDGRSLGNPMSGTQVQLVGLLGGLVRCGAEVAVLSPREIHPTVVPVLGDVRRALPFVDVDRARRPAVFHRPAQLGSLEGLAESLGVGERLVLTQQDMITDRSPAYATGTSSWQSYRATTLAALASADHIGFFSRHAALDAASEGVFELDRATVVALGVDHLGDPAGNVEPADPLDGRPYLLVLGNAYWHKNRVFAMRLLRWLVAQRGWDGGLVLAGGIPLLGSSAPAEESLLREAPSLEGRVVTRGHVGEAERLALYRGAELVLFPSLYEGFGLVPFEAAAMGRACLYSHLASMEEFLPPDGALPSFDLDESGAFVHEVLESSARREQVVSAVMASASGLTWDRTAAGYVDVYARAIDRPARGVSRVLLQTSAARSSASEMESLLLEVYRRRRAFQVGADAAIRGGALVLRAGRVVKAAVSRGRRLRRSGSGRAS